MRNRLLLLFLFGVVALWGGMPLVGQNVIVNGDFEQGSTGFETDYIEVVGPYGVEAGHYCIDNTTAHHGGGLGWPEPSGSNGNFMMVNGYGGLDNVTKTVWKETVSVTPQTSYTFMCRVVNFNRVLYGQIYPAILKVCINGNDHGTTYSLPTNNDWQIWTLPDWNSNSDNQAIIEIFDISTQNSNLGDDFGLDEISFVPGTTYSVTANDDERTACFGKPENMEVLGNDEFFPNPDDATLDVVTPPEHGSAVPDQDTKTIIYTFNHDGYYGGTDQFQYRVTNHGVSDEAWVYVSTAYAPSVGVVELPELICTNTTCEFVEPDVQSFGSIITDFGWEWANDPNGLWNTLILNPFDLPVEDYYLRFWAENGCGRAESEFVRMRVCDAPELNTMTISDPPFVCEGAWLPADYLSQVWVTNWNNDEGVAGWEVKHGDGAWMPQTSLSNGDWLRYRAENSCGETVTNAVMVHITQGPEFTGQPYPDPFESYYCLGATLTLPSDHPQYETHGMATEGFWAYWEGNEYQAVVNGTILTEEWDGRGLTYVLDSECGGPIPYPESFPLIVVMPPEVQSVTVTPLEVCKGSPIQGDAQIDWHHGTPDSQHCTWQYAPFNAPSAYVSFDPSQGIPETGMYYVNYHAVANECGFSGDCDEPTLIMVNTAPAFADNTPLSLPPFCVDDELVLPMAPAVTGGVDESGWKISVGYDSIGPYMDVELPLQLTLSDDQRWLQYYAQGCGDLITKEVQIRVDGKPGEPYNVENQLCVGQPFGYYSSSDIAPFDSWIWEYDALDGNYVPFDPDDFSFQTAGWFEVRYALINHCVDENNPEFSQPFLVEVALGPEFENSTLPNELSVCAGTTLEALLDEYNLTQPTLVDPTAPHADLGWYLRFKDANNVMQSVPIGMGTVLDMADNGKELCFGMTGDCSDSNIYSRGIRLTVSSPESVAISGETQVAVMTDYWPGKYYYCVDTEGVEVNWTLTPDIWPHGCEMVGDKSCCWVLVTSVGQADLKADIEVGCGSNVIHINATHFDVDETDEPSVKLYPNPTSHEVNVECEGLREVAVYDLLGHRIAHFSGLENRLSFGTEAFAPALYFIEIRTDKGLVRRTLSVIK